jgi:uncharacterized protein YqjF (DUF2071 family)
MAISITKPPRDMSFLQAKWKKLAIANYEVEPAILASYLPYGTELDLWQGKCYVSLVGFMFLDTRLLGIKIPFHVNFEEVNLRFYVQRREGESWKRGVVFIKEIVPKWALSFVANTIYKEHYETLPMRHEWREGQASRIVEYRWKKGGSWHRLKVEAALAATEIAAGSEAEFITEHYWGYARVNDSKTNEYEVTHPKWQQYAVLGFQAELDFGVVYGKAFEHLNHADPVSVMLAEGSEITVERKRVLRAAAT